jgi:hypothetical protein
MIVKENKNRIRWTELYAEQYLNLTPAALANVLACFDPSLQASTASLTSQGSHTTYSSGSPSMASINSTSPSAAADEIANFWGPRNREKDAEAVRASRRSHRMRAPLVWITHHGP